MKRPLTILAGAALIAAGCGGHAERPAVKPKPKHVFTYTASDVGGFFKAVTGDPLESDSSYSFDSLTPDRTDFQRSEQMSDRYGSFLIYVLHRAGGERMYTLDDGQPVKPDAQGIYWHQDDGQWEAMKPYENVVLEWMAEERSVDARFRRLDGVLSHLGEPAARAQAALPAEDRPCTDQGITPEAVGSQGTCRDEKGKTVTIVDRDTRLKVPGLQARIMKVETGRVVIPPNDYGMIKRAKGRFVLVAMRLKNTGDEPLRDLYEARLRIDGRIYDQSAEATFTVNPYTAFPIQPGDSSLAAVVFDVPVKTARRALTAGVLALPAGGDELSTVEDAARLGEIRLAKPGAAPPPGGHKA
jgi:hypothetical protein